MPRVRKGAARRQSNKRVLRAVKGHRGAARTQIRLAKEALLRAGAYAFSGRKQKKRIFRGIWITRLNAACKMRDMRYSVFIHGCKKAKIELDRKMLSEIAIADPQGFDKIVEIVKAALA